MSQNKKLVLMFTGLLIVGIIIEPKGDNAGLGLGGIFVLAAIAGLIWTFINWLRHRGRE